MWKRSNACSRLVLIPRGLINLSTALPLCSFEGARRVDGTSAHVPGDRPGRVLTRSLELSGGHGERDTPLPIPNRVVKPLRADGTWWATAWESRSPPGLTSKGRPSGGGPFVVLGRLSRVSSSCRRGSGA